MLENVENITKMMLACFTLGVIHRIDGKWQMTGCELGSTFIQKWLILNREDLATTQEFNYVF